MDHDLVYVGGDGTAVVDTWLGESQKILSNNQNHKFRSDLSDNIKSRQGLGHQQKTVKKQANFDGPLNLLLKSDNKKKKRKVEGTNAVDDEDIGVAHHGMVENLDDSKIAVLSHSSKEVRSSRSIGWGTSSGGTLSSHVQSVPYRSGMLDDHTEISTATNSNARMNKNSEEDTRQQRKRRKTRSKQKNIRKDNRPDGQKPSNRPLTKETQAVLGTKKARSTDSTANHD